MRTLLVIFLLIFLFWGEPFLVNAQTHLDSDVTALKTFLNQRAPEYPYDCNYSLLGYTAFDMDNNQWLNDPGLEWNNENPRRIQAIRWPDKGFSGNLDLKNLIRLQVVDCSSNFLTEVNASGLMDLNTLLVYLNRLSVLNVSGCNNLVELDCSSNQLTSIPLSLMRLASLNVSGNRLSSLTLTSCHSLTELDCSSNYLSYLDVRNLLSLKTLDCSRNENVNENNYTLLLGGCRALENLDCYGSPRLRSISFSGLTDLRQLVCFSTALVSLDLMECTRLRRLIGHYTPLTSLNVAGLTELQHLSCYGCRLNTLDLSGCTALVSVNAGDNAINSINLSACSLLEDLYVASNQLERLDTSEAERMSDLNCSNNRLTILDIAETPAVSFLNCRQNYLKFSTLPLYPLNSGCVYRYVPQSGQTAVSAPCNYIDLRHETGFNGQASEYKFYYLGQLIPSVNNRGINSVDKKFTGKKLPCKITNAAFPELTVEYLVDILESTAIPRQTSRQAKLYPSFVTAGQPVYIEIDPEWINQAIAAVYTPSGALLHEIKLHDKLTTISLPNIPGMYIIRLSYKKETFFIYKILQTN